MESRRRLAFTREVSSALADHEEEAAALDGLDGLDGEPGDGAVQRRGDRGFHLHGLDGRDHLPRRNRAPLRYLEGHSPDERGRYVPRDRAVGFLGGLFRGLDAAVADGDRAKLAVDGADRQSRRKTSAGSAGSARLTVLHLGKDFELIAGITGQQTQRLQ